MTWQDLLKDFGHFAFANIGLLAIVVLGVIAIWFLISSGWHVVWPIRRELLRRATPPAGTAPAPGALVYSEPVPTGRQKVAGILVALAIGLAVAVAWFLWPKSDPVLKAQREEAVHKRFETEETLKKERIERAALEEALQKEKTEHAQTKQQLAAATSGASVPPPASPAAPTTAGTTPAPTVNLAQGWENLFQAANVPELRKQGFVIERLPTEYHLTMTGEIIETMGHTAQWHQMIEKGLEVNGLLRPKKVTYIHLVKIVADRFTGRMKFIDVRYDLKLEKTADQKEVNVCSTALRLDIDASFTDEKQQEWLALWHLFTAPFSSTTPPTTTPGGVKRPTAIPPLPAGPIGAPSK